MAATTLILIRALLVLTASTTLAQAREIPPPAYEIAAHNAGIPSSVLYAVALQESGMATKGRLVPWPWSLNVAGVTRRYATRSEACADLHQALHDLPLTRIDVGLCQVNLGYHRHRYRNPCDLLDPYRNLATAADILHGHHTPGGDWLIAIGRYHRPAGGEPADRYRRKVSQHLVRILRQPHPHADTRRTLP